MTFLCEIFQFTFEYVLENLYANTKHRHTLTNMNLFRDKNEKKNKNTF